MSNGMKMKEDAAIDGLKHVKRVLDEHGIEYWLNSGTLLGAVRDGKLIKWDKDIDLGAWDKSTSEIIVACRELLDKEFEIDFFHDNVTIRKKGYYIDVTLYRLRNDEAVRTWIISNNLVGEILKYLRWVLLILIYDKARSEDFLKCSYLSRCRIRFIIKIFAKISSILPYLMINYFYKILWHLQKRIGSKYVMVAVPSHYFINLSTIDFYGMKFRVPAETEEYLAYRYGKDWSTPRKSWTFYEDDGAIRR